MPARKTHVAVSPYQQATYGREHDTDNEKNGKDCLGREDGLPGLESLLLESSV
jgi:hypothetical protein